MKYFRIFVLIAVLYCGMSAKVASINQPSRAGCNYEKSTIPHGYIITPGIGAHKLHLTEKTWNDARKSCVKEGAQLVVLRSAEEEALINKWQTEIKQNEAWLGIHDQFQIDDWVTTQDVPLAEVGYINWKKDQPDHGGGVEHRASYVVDGAGMNDLNCNWTKPYVCKICLD